MPVLTEARYVVKCEDCDFEYKSESLIAATQEAEKHLEGYYTWDRKEVEGQYDHKLRLTRYDEIRFGY